MRMVTGMARRTALLNAESTLILHLRIITGEL
jgi:hypothetical protein